MPRPKIGAQPGYLRRLLKDPQPVLDELADRLGPVYGFGFGPMRVAVIGDPVALGELLAIPTDSFRWNHKFNLLGFVVGDASMIVSDGAEHKRRRSSVQAAFSRRRLNGWTPHPFPFTARARVRSERKAIDTIIDEQITHRREDPTGDPLDVLEALIAAGDLSYGEMRDQVVTLIGAGFDTTAASLAWMMWRSALTPGLWERLRAEAETVFGPADDDGPAPDDSTLRQLELADRVMLESLRLHPAGVISPREAAFDVTVDDYLIPKGTLILWSAHLAGRDAEAWPDPLRFDPDRFVDLNDEQQALADAAWVPFGGGRRNFIGFALAQMELTLMIARLAQRLDLTPISEAVPSAVGMVVKRPARGVPMRVAARG